MNRSRPLIDACRGERGIILPLTLIILLILAGMVAVLLALGVSEPQIAANVLRSNQALSLAEAGAERAIAYFVVPTSSSGGADTVATACDPSCPSTPTATTLWSSQDVGGVGTYTVTWTPISYGTVLIESTGTASVGSVQRKVRVVVTRQWVTKFGILGKDVEVTGNGAVKGNVGAVQGNSSVQVTGSGYVQQSATTASTNSGDFSGTDCNASGNSCDPATGKGIGVFSASGAGKPSVTIPNVAPTDFLTKALAASPAKQVIVLGGGGTADPGVPSACSGQVKDTSGTLISPQPTTVGQHLILNELAIGATAACTLSPDGGSTGPFAGWQMHGAGEWEFSGSSTPPDGVFYATKEIKVTSSPGSSATPWKATFLAGDTKETGKTEIVGTPTINAYFNDLLTAAGEVKVSGNATLKGTLFGTSTTNDPTGNVEISGSATLTGNVISNAKAKQSAGQVIYNTPARLRLLSPNLSIVSWSAV